MKKTFFLLAFASIVTSSFAQQVPPSPPLTSEAYLKRARTQRFIAVSLLGTGGALFFGSTYRGLDNLFNEDKGLNGPFYTGLALMGASIPFIIAQHRNGKKSRAAATSLILEQLPSTMAKASGRSHYPALSFRVSL